MLRPSEILALGEQLLNEDRFVKMCGDSAHGLKFVSEITTFVQTIAAKASLQRVYSGLDDGYDYHGSPPPPPITRSTARRTRDWCVAVGSCPSAR